MDAKVKRSGDGLLQKRYPDFWRIGHSHEAGECYFRKFLRI